MPPSARHVIDENLALLRPLGIEAAGHRDFALSRFAAEADAVDRALGEAGITPDDLVVLNPGGGWPEKLWPAESFGALARGLRDRGLRALVTWGPGEEPLADRVVAASAGTAARCFATTLRGFTELARRARLVVAGDTGPLHLACAVGTPVVALFGPTDPARNGPFAEATSSSARLWWRPRDRFACARPHGRDPVADVLPPPCAVGPQKAARAPLPLGTGSRRVRRGRAGPVAGAAQRPFDRLSLTLVLGGEALRLGARATSRRRGGWPRAVPTRTPETRSTSAAAAGPGVAAASASSLGRPGRGRVPRGLIPVGDPRGGPLLEPDLPEEYGQWARDVPLFLPRLSPAGPRTSTFSWSRVAANKEWRTALAIPVVVALLWARRWLAP